MRFLFAPSPRIVACIVPAGDPDAGRLHHLIGSVASGVDVQDDASDDGLPYPPEGYYVNRGGGGGLPA